VTAARIERLPWREDPDHPQVRADRFEDDVRAPELAVGGPSPVCAGDVERRLVAAVAVEAAEDRPGPREDVDRRVVANRF
jgi:hypothetical protein